jgi:hypothetical protein
MVTAILTKYKRKDFFQEQLLSVQKQTIKVDEILVCDNTIDNKGVWERFKLAKKSKNDFVWVLDDDTIPAEKYLENVLECFDKKEGLYGTRGLLFKSEETYHKNYFDIGWESKNKKITQVDYVTHSWFFKKDWLQYFWNVKNPPFNYGEDMNFSYQLQKQGIKTYVPPHPKSNPSIWGSTKGREYGDDGRGLWISNPNNFRNNMFDYFYKQIDNGWQLINKKTLF